MAGRTGVLYSGGVLKGTGGATADTGITSEVDLERELRSSQLWFYRDFEGLRVGFVGGLGVRGWGRWWGCVLDIFRVNLVGIFATFEPGSIGVFAGIHSSDGHLYLKSIQKHRYDIPSLLNTCIIKNID